MKIRFWLLLCLLLIPGISRAQTAVLPSFADLVEKLSPSVVNISTTPRPDLPEPQAPLPESTTSLGENIFSSDAEHHVALGSGFILDTEGYILTNGHVIENAGEITVILHDNTPLTAVLVGTDRKTDLALIKIDTTKTLSPVKFGDSDKVRVGDWILAIGNPFGLGGSVTAGIISAKSRDIASGPYDNFIQTDASINQGSSGGPMFNLSGEVIGINTAIFSTTGGSMGVGFAIPANQAHFVIKQLKENGKVTRGWIGVKIQPNATDIAASLNLPEKHGIIISGVISGSTAQQAGIEAGDIILDIAGQKITNPHHFSRLIAETAIGQTIPATIWRNGQQLHKNIKIAAMPDSKPLPALGTPSPAEQPTDNNFASLGLKLSNIDENTLDKYHLAPSAKGIVVTAVITGSDAEKKGLKAGDIIIKIDKKDVFSTEDARTCIADAILENRRPILFSVLDKSGNMHFVAVKFAEKP